MVQAAAVMEKPTGAAARNHRHTVSRKLAHRNRRNLMETNKQIGKIIVTVG
jgi:hypothetical protein